MGKNKYLQLEYYASQGWPVFPINWIQKEMCSCGSSDCKSPGKHPLVQGGFQSATTDIEQIKIWHKKWPGANWGMRTGEASGGGAGFFAVDIDKKSGGYETWDVLLNEHIGPIETVAVNTGGGGQHLWFAHPSGIGIRSKAGVLGPGVDVRADDGYVVVPPSKTKREYRFELDPIETKISQAPKWILEYLNGRVKITKDKREPVGERIKKEVIQGERHQALVAFAGEMRRIGMEAPEIEIALKSVRGERFSEGDHPVTDNEIQEIVKWVAEKDKDYAFTDLGNAERFFELHAKDVRYCFTLDKWFVWDEKRWLIDDTAELIKRGHITVRSIYKEASNTKDEDKRKNIAKHAIKSEARSRVDNMLHSVKPYVPIHPEEMDLHPMLFNVANGMIDLTGGELLRHSRKFLLTKLIDVEYDLKAECPEWEKFIELITGGDQELQFFLQLALGYTLTGRTDEHCLFFLYGTGQNGKTTFTETMRRLFGDYAQRIDIEALLQYWKQGSAANPHIANMAGARFVLGSEIPENRKLNESLVKDLTGGDVMTARHLFSNPFTFTPTHKLWLFGNHKPKVTGTDWGLWRRMRVVPFNVTIPEEKRRPMSEVLESFEAEMSGILNWAVEGCLLWQSNGLEMVDSVKDATAEYRTEQDIVQQFIDEMCEMHPEHSVDKSRLYTAYRDWCEDGGEEQAKRKSKKWFTRQMTTRGCEHGGQGNKQLMGLKLRN